MMLRRILTGVLVLSAVLVAAAVPAGACPCQFTVEKIEIGAGAPGGTYTIRVAGPGGTFDVQVTAGQTTTVGELPPGDYTFTEVDAPPGATVEPSQVDIPPNGSVHVVVTNPYLAGRLSIQKVETGDAAPGGSYVFDVAGPDGSFQAEVAAGETWTSDWLPLGAYTITELDPPEGSTVVPETVTVDEDGETVTVVATNPYPASSATTTTTTSLVTTTTAPSTTTSPTVPPPTVAPDTGVPTTAVPTPTVAPGGSARTLPETGVPSSVLVLAAAVVLVSGALLLAASRRPGLRRRG